MYSCVGNVSLPRKKNFTIVTLETISLRESETCCVCYGGLA